MLPFEIANEAEYEEALNEAEHLMNLNPRTNEQTALLRSLVLLIEEYEAENYPFPV